MATRSARRRRPGWIAALATIAVFVVCGCGEGGDTTQQVHPHKRAAQPRSQASAPAETVVKARCPAGLPSCRSATGRIVYVERVDPDGDGDAHFVIVDSQGITLPDLTAIDVRKGLRPQPLPGPGDLISAAGPVQTGSYGQSQIHALELRVATP
jgi:hypothetical protein